MAGRARHALVALQAGTAVLAVLGGALLAAAPDGRLLRADPAALDGSPFASCRVPGLLLLVLVGGGFAVAAAAQACGARVARLLSPASGAGLVVFELAEVVWIGPQPLQAVFAAVGVAVVVLSLRRRG